MIPIIEKADLAMKKLMDARCTPSPIMREVALVAILKGIRQKDLAAKVGVTASNLIDHFKSRRPHESTVRAYASAVGMTEDHVAIARGSWAMSDSDQQNWGDQIQADVDWAEHYFIPGTRKKLDAALEPVDNITTQAIDEYALGECRGVSIYGDAGLPDWWPPGIKALAYALRHRFDLAKQLRAQPSTGRFLWGLWQSLQHQAFDESDRDSIIKITAALLRARGVDVGPMEAELDQEKSKFFAAAKRGAVTYRRKHSAKLVQSMQDKRSLKKGDKAR